MAPHDEEATKSAEGAEGAGGAESAVSRRDFLKTVGVAGVASTIPAQGALTEAPAPAAPAPPRTEAQGRGQTTGGAMRPIVERPYMRIRQEVSENLIKRGVVGYADRLRVQPGETIKFMVSSEQPRYRADIVRLIHGDANPKGPGIKEEVVDTPANAEYAGKRQQLPLGSYAIVPDNTALRINGSFSFAAWIAPTSQRGQTDDSFVGFEGLLTKWSGAERGGYGIFIDEAGRLSLWLTDASGKTEKLSAEQPLRPWVPAIPGMNNRPQGVTTSWYFVAVTYDAVSGRVELHQDPLNNFPFDPTRVTTSRTTSVRAIATSDAPLLIGAAWESAGKTGAHYNGKLESPRLYRRALTRQEIAAIKQGKAPSDALAAWDFSIDIESDKISDTASRKISYRLAISTLPPSSSDLRNEEMPTAAAE